MHADTQDLATIVNGAGQTGLATAQRLGEHGVGCVVLEEGSRIGDQWRRRYDSLLLNTPARWDGLPGLPFPAARSACPTGRAMGDYLESYASKMHLDVRCDRPVSRVEQTPDGRWAVTTGDQTLMARNVVVATGGEHHPRVPDVAARLDRSIRQLHSSGYHRPDQLLPGPVLVVGASQSGADLAMEAAGAGHQTWLSGVVQGEIPLELGSLQATVAGPVLWFVANHVLTLHTPMGRRLQPVIRAGGTPLLRYKRRHLDAAGVTRVEARTVAATDGRPTLEDGQVLDVSNVLWCTGFGQDFSFIHPSPVDEVGWPRGERGVSDLPGLFFVGLLFQSGFYSMLIGGAGRDAEHIARAVTAHERIARRQPVGSR